jgi:hypothetical protein
MMRTRLDRIARFAIDSVGMPVKQFRNELDRLFNGVLIGGQVGAVSVRHDPDSRDVIITVLTVPDDLPGSNGVIELVSA